jgi:putative phosphoesterase
MIFGVFSDVHDAMGNLEKAIDRFLKEKAEALVFCGDFCSPFSAAFIAGCGIPVHAVFGNNDGDRFNLLQKAINSDLKIYGEYIGDLDSQLVLDNLKIGVTHYPYYAKPMIKTGWYDCVFYGHSHKPEKQKFGNNLMLNPGEVAGLFGKPSVALVDTELKSSEIIYL